MIVQMLTDVWILELLGRVTDVCRKDCSSSTALDVQFSMDQLILCNLSRGLFTPTAEKSANNWVQLVLLLEKNLSLQSLLLY